MRLWKRLRRKIKKEENHRKEKMKRNYCEGCLLGSEKSLIDC